MVTQPAISRFAKHDAELASTSTATRCRLCAFLAAAPTVDADFIDALLRQPDKGHAHIQRVLAAGDVEIGESSIKRHRAKHLAA